MMKSNAVSALVIDTETDSGKDPRPLQVATYDPQTQAQWMKYFSTGRPISPITIAVHGITEARVAGLPKFAPEQFDCPNYLIGHNVRYDWRVIGKPDCHLICTVQLARRAFPHWQSYKLGNCIRALQLDGIIDVTYLTQQAHDAMADTLMCYHLYHQACQQLCVDPTDFAAVYALVQTTQAPKTMPFGKHKGKRFDQIPIGYLNWALNNLSEIDDSLRLALQSAQETLTQAQNNNNRP